VTGIGGASLEESHLEDVSLSAREREHCHLQREPSTGAKQLPIPPDKRDEREKERLAAADMLKRRKKITANMKELV
jgi:hypothetical protein